MVSLIVGPRTERLARELWEDFVVRTDDVLPELITTDEYAPYRAAILNAYGTRVEYPRTGRPGRPRHPRLERPAGLAYAMVHKTWEGAVVDVSIREVFGTKKQLERAIERSMVSSHVNTTFVERFNGTVRQHNSRKARKVYAFSTEFEYHVAMSWFAAATTTSAGRTSACVRKRKAGGPNERRRWRAASAIMSGRSTSSWVSRSPISHLLAYRSTKQLFGLPLFALALSYTVGCSKRRSSSDA